MALVFLFQKRLKTKDFVNYTKVMISFQAQNSWIELLLNQLHTFMILFSFLLSRFLTLEVNFKLDTSQFAAVMGITSFFTDVIPLF